jgi:hypothetical protein
MKGLLTSGCLLLALWGGTFGVQASCSFASGVSGEIRVMSVLAMWRCSVMRR